MRENRPYGLEGGESGSTGLPYPYANSVNHDRVEKNTWLSRTSADQACPAICRDQRLMIGWRFINSLTDQDVTANPLDGWYWGSLWQWQLHATWSADKTSGLTECQSNLSCLPAKDSFLTGHKRRLFGFPVGRKCRMKTRFQ